MKSIRRATRKFEAFTRGGNTMNLTQKAKSILKEYHTSDTVRVMIDGATARYIETYGEDIEIRVCMMRYKARMEYRDIAEKLHYDPRTIYKKHNRALERLAVIMFPGEYLKGFLLEYEKSSREERADDGT